MFSIRGLFYSANKRGNFPGASVSVRGRVIRLYPGTISGVVTSTWDIFRRKAEEASHFLVMV